VSEELQQTLLPELPRHLHVIGPADRRIPAASYIVIRL
jgi:hypothetical protein